MFALLDAMDESHVLAVGTVAVGMVFSTAKDDNVDHTEGTAREDGDSQPLLDLDTITDPFVVDTITDPIVDTLTAHDRVLTSTIAGVAGADRALDLDITGVATTLDDNDDDVTDATTMALLMPTVLHGNATESPATMATMMLVLRTMQSQNQAILNRLDAMDNTSKDRHGRLRAALKQHSGRSYHCDWWATDLRHVFHCRPQSEPFARDDNLQSSLGTFGEHAVLTTRVLGLLFHIIR